MLTLVVGVGKFVDGEETLGGQGYEWWVAGGYAGSWVQQRSESVRPQSCVMRSNMAPSLISLPRARCGRRIVVISLLRRRRAGWRPSSAGCWTPCLTFSPRRHGQRPPRRCHHRPPCPAVPQIKGGK